MLTIDGHLSEFTAALKEKETLVFSKNKWRCAKWYREIFDELFQQNAKSMVKVGRAFNEFLDSVERQSVLFANSSQVRQEQADRYAEIFEAARAVKSRLKAHLTAKESRQMLCEIKRHTLSLKYRIRKELGGENPLEQPNPTLMKNVKQSFAHKNKEYSPAEEQALAELCRYPKFVKLMLSSKDLVEETYKRIIIGRFGVAEFVEYHGTYKRMNECLLLGWIGRFGKNFFSIENENTEHGERKVVKIMMDGTKVNLLDEEKWVTFDGHLEKSIKSVLEVFKAKNNQAGDFAVFEEGGIRRFNVHVHDKFNPETKLYEPIHLFNPNASWWEHYPVFERISRQELLRRYPKAVNEEGKWGEADTSLGTNKWLVVEKASSQKEFLDLDGSHGYMDIYIPTPSGEYILYPFGKFASNFPRGFLGRLKFIVGTFISKISFGDENHCYFFRQHGAIPYAVGEQKSKTLMDEIRKDILLAREGNLVFQFPWENCSQWVYKKLKIAFGKKKHGGLIENNYKMAVLDTRPSNFILKFMVKVVRRFPKKTQAVATYVALLGFGSFRKKTIVEDGVPVKKSVAKSGFRKKQKVYIPGLMLDRIKEESIRGFVTTGPIQ